MREQISQKDCFWYEKPAEEWIEALPLGNGRLGAMVYGGTVVFIWKAVWLWSMTEPASMKMLKFGLQAALPW